MTRKKKIVCFGPGPKFKGGISNYNTALAKALDKREDTEIHIVSWINQYPSIIPREFIDKSSKKDLLEGTDIQVTYMTDYNKPWTWKATAEYIIDLNPDMVIFQWAIAIQGLPMGRIAKIISKKSNAEIIFDLHFVIQKEGSKLDNLFTRMAIKHADTYIAHAYKTVNELKELMPDKKFSVCEDGNRDGTYQTVIKLYHPIYNLFQPDPSFDIESFKKQNGLKQNVFLFFGFIRKYKGLHYAIKAFKKVADQREDVSFLICGESFWQTLDTNKWSTRIKTALFGLAKSIFLSKKEDEKEYKPLELIKELNLENSTMVVNEFVPNEEVHKYFQAADVVVLFYEYATPSGIESLSYNFKKPLLATRVGHFPETIEDGFNGYLAEPGNITDMANQMLRYLNHPLPAENVALKTKDMSWDNYAAAIMYPN